MKLSFEDSRGENPLPKNQVIWELLRCFRTLYASYILAMSWWMQARLTVVARRQRARLGSRKMANKINQSRIFTAKVIVTSPTASPTSWENCSINILSQLPPAFVELNIRSAYCKNVQVIRKLGESTRTWSARDLHFYIHMTMLV
jgi:hypothetical protein